MFSCKYFLYHIFLFHDHVCLCCFKKLKIVLIKLKHNQKYQTLFCFSLTDLKRILYSAYVLLGAVAQLGERLVRNQ